MHFMELAQARYSVRKFSEKPVEGEKLTQLLEAARLAPTAHNNQPQRLLVIQSPEALLKLKDCTPYHFGAPLAILVSYDRDAAWVRKYDGCHSGDVDASIAGTHIMMAAADLGRGSTGVMQFDPAAIREAYHLPEHFVPVALFPIGYPADDAKPAPGHAQRNSAREMTANDDYK